MKGTRELALDKPSSRTRCVGVCRWSYLRPPGGRPSWAPPSTVPLVGLEPTCSPAFRKPRGDSAAFEAVASACCATGAYVRDPSRIVTVTGTCLVERVSRGRGTVARRVAVDASPVWRPTRDRVSGGAPQVRVSPRSARPRRAPTGRSARPIPPWYERSHVRRPVRRMGNGSTRAPCESTRSLSPTCPPGGRTASPPCRQQRVVRLCGCACRGIRPRTRVKLVSAAYTCTTRRLPRSLRRRANRPLRMRDRHTASPLPRRPPRPGPRPRPRPLRGCGTRSEWSGRRRSRG